MCKVSKINLYFGEWKWDRSDHIKFAQNVNLKSLSNNLKVWNIIKSYILREKYAFKLFRIWKPLK